MKKFNFKSIGKGEISLLISCIMVISTCTMSLLGAEGKHSIYIVLLAIHTMLVAIYDKIGDKNKTEDK